MSQSWSTVERARLADALTAAGPGAPTLCEGWRTEHLATHLVLRDRTPWRMSDARVSALAQDATESAGFAPLVAQVAEGPARWAPGHWAGDQMNLLEFFVHTEDVVRAQPGAALTSEIEPERAAAMWKQYRLFAKLMFRKVPVGVVLVVEDGPRAAVRSARRGHGTVVVTGSFDDVVLFGFGRGAATRVRLSGSDADVSALLERFPGPAADVAG